MFLWKATSLQQPFDCPLVFATPGLDLTQTIGQLSIKSVNFVSCISGVLVCAFIGR